MKKTIIITAIVLAVFGAMAWTLSSNKKEINRRKEVKSTDAKIAVTVEAAQVRESSGQLELVGMASPDKEVVVAADVAGKIVQVNFNMGDFVSKGSLLAKVEDTYKRLAYENAKLSFDKNKEDYERYQVLRKGDAVSENQLRDAKNACENASIQLENAKKQWEDTKIIAPFSGVITAKKTELGAYVNVGNAIAGMADVAQLKVVLAVSESNVYQLKKGQEVKVTASVYPGVTFRGKISNISPQGSNAHTYLVEVSIANDGKSPLKAGTYVNVQVDMGKAGRALMIPRDAIVSTVKDPSVYVLNGESVKLVKINAGADYQSYLEVVSGLAEGDQVVTSGQINLMDGAKVTVIKK